MRFISVKQAVVITMITAAFSCTIAAPPARADQLFFTAKELVKMADVAVIGTLVDKHQITLAGEQKINLGVLRIEKHFKGLEKTQTTLLLQLAPYHKAGLTSTDVLLPENAQGLWLLQKYPSGLYRLERSDALRPEQDAAELFKGDK
ncbi:hypothetical protein [Thalassomonas actiniarum]|uniref:Uncharacterized protein n=1 Tax=Thalassomonas actiniarum TaxID=485447 RepID=A0AAF0C1U9_9GAMM|nr:hypothetical protein [Thalassomonas actiniarum]WDD97135.1 hypothetical protein SG35_017470 [Thalassomonas actiniarum]